METKALTTAPKAQDVAATLRNIADKVENGQAVVTRIDLYQDGTLDFYLVVRGYAVPVKQIGAARG